MGISAFADKSGTCSGTINTFTTVDAASGSRAFFRIFNNNATAMLWVWDKTGSAVKANSFSIAPGTAYVWDVMNTNTSVQIASDTISATYEACGG